MVEQARPDATLWLEATSGTEASFGVIYDRYRARIFRKAYARVLDVADAEDIVALVFLEAWRRRADVRLVDGSLLPWLLVVTGNVTSNRERSMRRYRRLLAKVPPAAHVPDPSVEVAERIDGERMSHELRAAITRLPAIDQRLVDLCLVEQLSMATVASVLDVPVGTVKSRLARVRSKLQGYLRAQGIDGSSVPDLDDVGVQG